MSSIILSLLLCPDYTYFPKKDVISKYIPLGLRCLLLPFEYLLDHPKPDVLASPVEGTILVFLSRPRENHYHSLTYILDPSVQSIGWLPSHSPAGFSVAKCSV